MTNHWLFQQRSLFQEFIPTNLQQQSHIHIWYKEYISTYSNNIFQWYLLHEISVILNMFLFNNEWSHVPRCPYSAGSWRFYRAMAATDLTWVNVAVKRVRCGESTKSEAMKVTWRPWVTQHSCDNSPFSARLKNWIEFELTQWSFAIV